MYIVTSGMNPNEDHIEHHGVLGMRWGVHRARRLYAKKERAKAKGNTAKAAKYNAKYNQILKKHNDIHSKSAYKGNLYNTTMLNYAKRQREDGDITRKEYEAVANGKYGYKNQAKITEQEYWRSVAINSTLENNPNIDFGKDYVSKLFNEKVYGDISKDAWTKKFDDYAVKH